MCLYPKALKNPKYKPNKKNNGTPPPITDQRLLYVQIPCRHCIECRKQKANEWRLRVIQELKNGQQAHMVTLTLSTESLKTLALTIKDIDSKWGYSLDNDLGNLAIKRFLGRWRKQYGKAPRHWLVSELGKSTTEHLHFHGIIWTDKPKRITDLWAYGFTWIGSYVGERTANYCVKYILKPDPKHPNYRPKLYTSKGIGKNYLQSRDAQNAKYNGKETREYATTRTGHKIYLPAYYRNKLYTDQQREQLWIEKLDSEKRTVMGQTVSISRNNAEYLHLLHSAQCKNERLGFSPLNQRTHLKDAENDERAQIQKKRLDIPQPTD